MSTSAKIMEQEAFDRITLDNAKKMLALLMKDSINDINETTEAEEEFRTEMTDNHGQITPEKIYTKFPQLNPSAEGKVQVQTQFIQKTIDLYKTFCTETYGEKHEMPDPEKLDNGTLKLSFSSNEDALTFAKSQSDKNIDFVMSNMNGEFESASLQGEFFTDETLFKEKSAELNYVKCNHSSSLSI